MKNVIKRVSAFAMAFTILGAGSAITQSFLPQLGNSIVASAATYHIDTTGINLIKQHEALRLVAYKVQKSDPYYTIGFGHYGPDVYAGMVITEAEAVELLKNDLVKYEQKVQKQTTGLDLSQSQYNALVSLCYNTGGGNSIISNSPLVKFLKEEYSEKTAKEKYASYYVTSNGQKLKGLVNRRNAEADYFFSQNASDLPFIDVKPSDWFADAVKFVYDNGIMSGTSTTTFAPLNTLTRGQFVTVLYNMKGRPYVAFDPNKFTDVKQNDYFANPVMWAVNNDITSGTGNRKFSPNENITREQVAVMLYKYAKLLNYDTSISPINLQQFFTDANKVDSWASDAMKWAVTNNIISGKATNSGKKLDPLGNSTRAECAQMIKNFVKKFGK